MPNNIKSPKRPTEQRLQALELAMSYLSPLINKDAGEVGPPASLMVNLMMAVADGLNWDPLGDGNKNAVIYYDGLWHALGGGAVAGDPSVESSLPGAPATGKWRLTLLANGDLVVQTHSDNYTIGHGIV